MKTSFARSAALLAVIGIIAKIMGAMYRVPLTNTVGAEGMGLYQMVFPVYTVLLAFCGGAMSSAVSRVVAKYTARGDELSAVRAVRVATVPLAAVSLCVTIAVIVFRGIISTVQGNPDASLCYLALAPSLLFSGMTAVLRGYFQGKSNMVPSGVSQLIEQVVKLFLGLYFAKAFLRFGVKYAVCGALLGVTASEVLALSYLFIKYARSKKKCPLPRKKSERNIALSRPLFEAAQDGYIVSDAQLRREIAAFSFPVTLGSLVIPLTQMIDSALVINLLMRSGVGRTEATALFGLLVGPVGTLINLPTVIIASVSVAFLPALTSDLERGGDGGRMTKLVAQFVLSFVIPVTIAFLLFPDKLCAALYSRGLTEAQLSTASRLLRIQAVSVFYVGAYQVFATVLQTRGRAHRPVVNLAIGGAVKIALTPLFVVLMGVEGAAAATVVCYGVAAALTAYKSCKLFPIGASVKKSLLFPLIFSAAGALTFYGVDLLLSLFSLPAIIKTAIATVAFMTVYALCMTVSGVIDIRTLLGRGKNTVISTNK